MKVKRSLQRALALLCCAAMLLPCLSTALAAGDGTAEFVREAIENYING